MICMLFCRAAQAPKAPMQPMRLRSPSAALRAAHAQPAWVAFRFDLFYKTSKQYRRSITIVSPRQRLGLLLPLEDWSGRLVPTGDRGKS